MSTTSNKTYGPIVPEGQYPPFAVVTPDDHAAWIIIAAATGMFCSLFFGTIRYGVRKFVAPKFGLDDYTLAGATLLMVIQTGIILGACTNGLGKSVDLVSSDAQDRVQSMYYASNLFFVLALGLSKVSVGFFLRRLSRAKHHKLVYNVAIGLMGVWTVASFFALALQCNLGQPWTIIGQNCGTGVLRRWQIISAFDILSELLLVGMAMYLVWSLQTSWEAKAVVVCVFSFRLVGIIAIGFRLATFDEAGFSTNPFLLESTFICWTQSELNWSLIAATIPSFQSFLKNLNTGFGGLGLESSYGYGSGRYGTGPTRNTNKNTNNMSFQMSSMRSNIDHTIDEKGDEEAIGTAHSYGGPQNSKPGIGPMLQRNNSGQDPETRSIGSNESRRMMIRKDVTWNTTIVTAP